MKLESVKLANIRSYVSEKIEFPEGSVLLSGHIGSGKSTILHAIEFALFGTLRNLNEGSSLLRRGESTGSVELTFLLDNKRITISRTLKVSGNSVSQGSGYIISEGVRTELMPTELKARILDLLGYPKARGSKSRDLIYRYTVYTPQEEMKAILFEDADARLNTLRTVFQIDKYKTVRDNYKEIVRPSLGLKIAELSGKTEDLAEKKKRLDEVSKNRQFVLKGLEALAPDIKSIQNRMVSHKALLDKYEGDVKSFNKLEIRLSSCNAELTQGNQFLERLKKELELTEKELKNLQASLSGQAKVESDFGLYLGILNHHVAKLTGEVSSGELVKAEAAGIESQLIIVADKFSQAQAVLSESKKLEKNVLSSDSCPVCLQPIAEAHKERFRVRVSSESAVSAGVIKESAAEKERLNGLLAAARKKSDLISVKQQNLSGFSATAKRFAEDARSLGIPIPGFENGNYEIQNVLESLSHRKKSLENLPVIKSSIKEKTSRTESLKEQISETSVRVREAALSRSSLEEQLQKFSSVQPERESVKSRLDAMHQEEKSLIRQKTTFETDLKNLDENASVLSAEIEEKEADKKILGRMLQLRNWMDELFVNLMGTMEKAVMQRVHSQFDELFKRWFNVLLEDDNASAGIDDSFAPVIEINGYEASLKSLSGGEKTGCALAYRLALNRVINDVISNIKTSDLLMLDEPTDGFSSPQLEKVRDVLDQLRLSQIILVSHESEMESFVQNVLRVVKEHHVSRVS